jgi:hypothetical protein
LTGCLPLEDPEVYSRPVRQDQGSALVRDASPSEALHTGPIDESEIERELNPEFIRNSESVSSRPRVEPAVTVDAGLQPCGGNDERTVGYDATTGRCHQFFEEPSTWLAARARCRLAGAELVAIGSAAEDDFLSDAFTAPYWIGASDGELEGSFRWDTGEPFRFSRFGTGEPNDLFNSQDCIEKRTANEGWHDRGCAVLNPFVCEALASRE